MTAGSPSSTSLFAPRSALLITLEATRRDALGAYGAAPSVTPHLDDLAEEAIRYEWARSVAPLSRPAHASIATGLYPPRHGLRSERSQALADRAVTVAERARAAGFATAAFLGSRALDESSGLLQGFEHHGAPPPGDPTFGDVPKRPAAEVVGEATAWLQERPRERPFFLWVHCSDARRPRHGTDAPETAAYLEEVGAIDRALGELFAVLAAEDLLEETFVAVAGAGGEALGEHGELGAGLELWDSTLRVPLLLRYHDGFGAGEASSEIVSVADLAPTLLEAMGLESRGSGDLDGTSLYYQSVATDRGVYFESYDGWERFGWSPLVGVADARGKLGVLDELDDESRPGHDARHP